MHKNQTETANRRPLQRPRSGFRSGTGMMGATEPGQRVTPHNERKLPPGSVVSVGDGSRLIHLHDDLWLWCKAGAWCYERWENLAWRLDKQAVACHVATLR
jgi:hypothetical protein